jgi:hypothetical protein
MFRSHPPSFAALLAYAILAAAWLPAPVRARPTLPDLPLGTASAAFAGGGVAHAAGVGSLFGNPAALSVRDAFQAEAGLMGLSAGLSPYFLFGAPAGERASYALGYWYDARPGDPDAPVAARQGLVAGGAFEASPWSSLGATLKCTGTGEGIGSHGFGIDADLGAQLRPWKAAWLGLVARNAMESGVGQEPEGFRTHRSYGASLGTGRPMLSIAGLRLHDPDAYYELRSQGLPPSARVAHAFSLASAFLPGGRLGFRGTLALAAGSAPGLAWATFLNLPLGNGAVVAAYVVHAGGGSETGEGGISHSVSVNFRMGGRLDPLPPTLEATADRASLAVGDTVGVHFHLLATDLTYVHGKAENPQGESRGWAGRQAALDEGRSLAPGRIRAWTLSICGTGANGLAGPPVRVYQGKDLPPRVILWQADDAAGRKLLPGFYAFRMEAEDAAGNAAATAWQLIRLAPLQAPAPAPAQDSLSPP